MVFISDPSSSTTNRYPCFSYDVFLSFRGEDTRKKFTDHLYKALDDAGIHTFRDDDAMERGKLLGPELKKAINESAISIIVFSRNYASSKWCLDEVLTIIEERKRVSSKHEVVPVFYDVEPSDVRNQTGSFGKAFGEYDDKIEKETDHRKKMEWSEKVEAWRVSLREAGSLTGMVLANRPEAEFISDIVKVTEKKLNRKLLYIEEKLVGIKYNVDKIEAWLQDPSPNEVILLIHGMGGIGKTTISQCIFNSNFREYDRSCFLANIKDTSLLHLQRQLLSEILRNGKEETIWNVDQGTIKIRNAICNKKVLLILDDVTTAQQINALLAQDFYPGSKVIITTRHKWLSNVFKVHPKVHSVRELGDYNSIELFSLYAFDQEHPIEPYIVQSERVVRHCRGLPLALKVLGSSLRGKTIAVWEDAMRKLEAIPNPEIQKILKVSYETLEDEKDKDLFLHVACFFVEEDKDFIVKILAECDLFPVVGIDNLMDRCLLYIDKNGRVMMHQLIKEMGREVVRQESPKDPGKRSRLWHHQDSINVLRDNAGTRKVEGLILDMQRIKEANLTSIVKMDNERKGSYRGFLGRTKHANGANFNIGALGKMKNLMLLQLDYVTFSGRYKKLPEKLRWLRWHGFSLKSIPRDIPLEKLVVLDLRYSKLKQVWDGYKWIGSLKILDLSYSVELIKTPVFRGLPNLESLILKGCLRLIEVCESISDLDQLALLDVSDCRRLRDIPRLPRSLVSLEMSGCPNLGVHGPVQCLDSISLSSLLKKLNISYCNLFDYSFSNDWSNLVSLEKLNMDGNNITSLPKCIQSLPTLLELEISWCPQLQSVEGVPKSVILLVSPNNASLEKVNHAQNPSSIFSVGGCDKLCEVEGWAKLRSVESISRQQMGFEKHKVSDEFAVFNAFISQRPPRSYFRYTERSARISFKVPSHPNNSRISGLVVFVILKESVWLKLKQSECLHIQVNNKTKALVWDYLSVYLEISGIWERKTWLSFWKCGNLLENGDEIVVRFSDVSVWDKKIKSYDNECVVVEECGINFLYEEDEDEVFEDDEECDGERKEVCHVDQTSWKDRLLKKLENTSL